jgi:tRNA pseudouridine32 synthase/23S rRNA pseudouridine746 synthase/23S rRNA pseudouridine1911/1915/1917 synthase
MKHILSKSMTLLEVLAILAPDSSNSTLRSWLKVGRVQVDGHVEKVANRALEPGQTVTVGEQPKFVDDEIRIIYEDKHIIAIDKPRGLLSVATDFDTSKNLHSLLKAKFKPRRVYPVHRLDQDTSGVIIFALSEAARDELKSTFEKHAIERRYKAIVEGHLKEKSGVWSSYQYEDKGYYVRTTQIPEKGKLAVTHYAVIKESQNYTLLDLALETGRKNQIRVHCKEAGHPVAGDKKYGAVTDPIKRLCLHAYLLVMDHPITKKKMRFESDVPKIFKQVVP